MLNTGCVLLGILAITGVTVDSEPYYNYGDYSRVHQDRYNGSLLVHLLDYDRQQERSIIGGYPIEIKEYPSTVLVLTKVDEMQIKSCAGSIVSKRWIVTAGHCVHGSQPPDITIGAGVAALGSGGKIYKAEHYIIHSGFEQTDKTRAYDIALVRIEGAFDLDDRSIAISSLPGEGKEVLTGDKLVMLGWGHTSLAPSSSTDKLHKVVVEVLDEEECSVLLPNYVHDYMFCTASLVNGIHKGGMSGDSGGPLFDGHTLVGIHTSGYRSYLLATPDKNLRISTFKQWILDTTVDE